MCDITITQHIQKIRSWNISAQIVSLCQKLGVIYLQWWHNISLSADTCSCQCQPVISIPHHVRALMGLLQDKNTYFYQQQQTHRCRCIRRSINASMPLFDTYTYIHKGHKQKTWRLQFFQSLFLACTSSQCRKSWSLFSCGIQFS